MKTRTVLIGIGIALALVALVAGGWLLGSQLWGAGCWEYGPGTYGPGTMGGYGAPWGMHTFGGGILMFLFWGVIIGGIALLVIGLARQGAQPASRSESPLEILKRRYASGEIDRQEFERMKEWLSR
jgi:putative membrane protein